jgi:prevent-host-death family protein
MEATMHEAKTSLSKLVARANAGEEVILTTGKARTPVARIVPFSSADAVPRSDTPTLKKRPIGFFAKEMGSGPIFIEPMTEEELALWEAPLDSTWTSNSPEDSSELVETK